MTSRIATEMANAIYSKWQTPFTANGKRMAPYPITTKHHLPNVFAHPQMQPPPTSGPAGEKRMTERWRVVAIRYSIRKNVRWVSRWHRTQGKAEAQARRWSDEDGRIVALWIECEDGRRSEFDVLYKRQEQPV